MSLESHGANGTINPEGSVLRLSCPILMTTAMATTTGGFEAAVGLSRTTRLSSRSWDLDLSRRPGSRVQPYSMWSQTFPVFICKNKSKSYAKRMSETYHYRMYL